jgi:hypothetical protein
MTAAAKPCGTCSRASAGAAVGPGDPAGALVGAAVGAGVAVSTGVGVETGALVDGFIPPGGIGDIGGCAPVLAPPQLVSAAASTSAAGSERRAA